MPEVNEPFVSPTSTPSPTSSTNPAASVEVIRETYDGPQASIEYVRANEARTTNPSPGPAGPMPSVDIEKRGIEKDGMSFG